MPAATQTILRLYDGTTTLMLTDGNAYALQEGGWAPAVHVRRGSSLGGMGYYNDGTESITINVYGTSAANCLANLAALSAMLDAAQAWSDEETDTPIMLLCQMQGSSTIWQAVIVGAESRTDAPLTLTSNTADYLPVAAIEGVQLTIRHRPWTGLTSTTGGSSGVASGEILTATPGGLAGPATYPSPLQIVLTPNARAQDVNAGSVLAVTHSADAIYLHDAALQVTTGFSTVTDTTNHSRSGTVLRRTSTTAPGDWWPTIPILSTLHARSIAVYATVRANSASPQWAIRLRYKPWDPSVVLDGPEQAIPQITTPQVIYLGTVTMNLDTAHSPYIGLAVKCDTTSGSPTLDIDYLMAVALDDPGDHVIVLHEREFYDAGLSNNQWWLDHTARMQNSNTTTTYTADSQGRADLLTTGDTVAVCLMATGGDSPAYWRPYTSGHVLQTWSLTVTRGKLTVVPT